MQREPYLLHPTRCCLMVIDPQERLMQAIYKAEKVIKTTVLMIQSAKVLGIPIIATTQYVKGLGPFVPEIAALLEGENAVDKVEFNAFANEKVVHAVAQLPSSVDTVLITGVEAHICVMQSAIGATQQGFVPWVIADAISSREKKNAKYALARMRSMGIEAGPAEMAVYELLGRAGTKEFKELLPYLK